MSASEKLKALLEVDDDGLYLGLRGVDRAAFRAEAIGDEGWERARMFGRALLQLVAAVEALEEIQEASRRPSAESARLAAREIAHRALSALDEALS